MTGLWGKTRSDFLLASTRSQAAGERFILNLPVPVSDSRWVAPKRAGAISEGPGEPRCVGRCRGARRGGEGVPKLPANTSQSSSVTRGARAAAAPRCAGCAEGRPAGRIVFTHTWLFLAPARPAARPARGSQGSRRAVRTPPCRWRGRSRNRWRCQEGAALCSSLLGPHGHRCPSGPWVWARLSCCLCGLRPPQEVVHGIAVNTVSASMV